MQDVIYHMSLTNVMSLILVMSEQNKREKKSKYSKKEKRGILLFYYCLYLNIYRCICVYSALIMGTANVSCQVKTKMVKETIKLLYSMC